MVMSLLPAALQELLVVYAVYVIATASPGPSNMAIMGVAMQHGRVPALALACGVLSGSLIWAVLAATGVSALLAAYSQALLLIKLFGGLYLLYLAGKAARSAFRAGGRQAHDSGAEALSLANFYRRGLALHLLNPKAVLAWVAIMSLGVGAGRPSYTTALVIAGCAVIGVLVFGSYALLFSSAPLACGYKRFKRWIEATLALAFGFAGMRLLLSRT